MNLHKLINDFEKIRNELNELGIKYGLKHPKVIDLSEILDKLHLEIIRNTNRKQVK